MAKMKPIPKKSLQQKIKEEAQEKEARAIKATLYKQEKKNKERKVRLSLLTEEERVLLDDYIFRDGEVNPLSDEYWEKRSEGSE